MNRELSIKRLVFVNHQANASEKSKKEQCLFSNTFTLILVLMPKLLCSLRNTQSPNLYNEQLGLRALCISEHRTKLYCD